MNAFTLLKKLFTILILVCIVACGGSDDSSSANNSNNDVVATETWQSDIGNNEGGGEWTFKRKSDGSIYVDGSWSYWGNAAPSKVSCPFSNGKVDYDGTKMSFFATGIGTLESGGLTSGFELSVSVSDVNNQTSVPFSYSIEFDDPSWSDHSDSGYAEFKSGSVFAVTYYLSGTWNYTMEQTYNSEGGLDPVKTGQLVLTQNNTKFTIDSGDGDPESGTVSGNHYNISFSETFDGGIATHKMSFIASSSEQVSGTRETTVNNGTKTIRYKWNFSATKAGRKRMKILLTTR